MGFDFTYPWALLLIPIGVLIIVLIDRRYTTHTPSLRRRVSLWMRLVLTCVLVLAISMPSVMLPSGKVTRWILLDMSDSSASVQSEMQANVKTALEHLPEGEEAGVIVFGANAMVETPLSQSPSFTGVHTAIDGSGSDLDSALMLASALMPSDNAGSITVITDGNVTTNQTTANIIGARGIQVDSMSVETSQITDAQLTEITSPSTVYEGQTIPIQVVIDANAAMEGSLVLYQNGELTATRDVKLSTGENRFAFSDTAAKTGVVTYQAQFISPSDMQSRNNRASTHLQISGAPTILLVSQTDSIGSLFTAAGLKVEIIRASELPATAERYLPYDAIVLNNIDYESAGSDQWGALSSAVKTLSRGLCVLGGDSSFALGNYRGTVLEELMPVTIDVRNKLQVPALSLIIAIDKSGSMTSGQFGVSRIEIAKEAAMQAAEVLSAQDNIGVIAFDDQASWAVPFQKITDIAAIQSMIGTIRAGGGTAFYSPLQASFETLAAADTPQKHIIFLSDGQPGDSEFQNIALAMKKAGITLTTVAIGNDANSELMKLLSTLGGGRSYVTTEFDNLPKIFTKETMLAGASYVQNRIFTPVITETSTLTAYDGFPQLAGYLTTVEKPTATVSLQSDMEDPILSWWNVGTGKTIAWTSDAQGAWTENFLNWESAASFFGGMVAKVLPGVDREGELSATVQDTQMSITYQIDSANGQEGLETTVIIVSPDGSEQESTLTEVEPGIYEGKAEAELEGAYALRLSQSEDGTQVRSQESGAVKTYAKEYDLRGESGSTLASLMQATGGHEVTDLGSFWDQQVTSAQSRKSLFALLLLLSLILLLLDIALRKLPWEDAFYQWMAKHRHVKQLEAKVSSELKEPEVHKPKTKKAAKIDAQKARNQAAEQTTDALLSALNARKKK